MQPKDSKKIKATNQNSNQISNNKKIENKIIINKVISKTKSSKLSPDSNTHSQKTTEQKINSNIHSKIKNINYEKKNKKMTSNYQTKTSYERRGSKYGPLSKQKISHKITTADKKTHKNSKKNSCIFESKKNPFVKQKTNDDIAEKKKKIEFYKNYANIINSKQQNNVNNENITGIGTRKLLEFLVTLSPIDTSKCDELITKNISKIIEIENKIKDIIQGTQDEIKNIKDKYESENKGKNTDNSGYNKIHLEKNIEIIGKESKMRKSIYKLLFSFIMQLLEQINKLSYNIANKELNNIPNNDNLFMNNNNPSIISNNSLFISDIQDDFCERLFNITKSFISSDIDLSEINGKNNGDIKNNAENFGKILDDNLFKDEEEIIDYNRFDSGEILKSKKNGMIHPNEILDKVQNNEKKDKKIIHYYSNSLKVNSNLEKLEKKKNKDEENIKDEQFDNIDNIDNFNKGKNCIIY